MSDDAFKTPPPLPMPPTEEERQEDFVSVTVPHTNASPTSHASFDDARESRSSSSGPPRGVGELVAVIVSDSGETLPFLKTPGRHPLPTKVVATLQTTSLRAAAFLWGISLPFDGDRGDFVAGIIVGAAMGSQCIRISRLATLVVTAMLGVVVGGAALTGASSQLLGWLQGGVFGLSSTVVPALDFELIPTADSRFWFFPVGSLKADAYREVGTFIMILLMWLYPYAQWLQAALILLAGSTSVFLTFVVPYEPPGFLLKQRRTREALVAIQSLHPEFSKREVVASFESLRDKFAVDLATSSKLTFIWMTSAFGLFHACMLAPIGIDILFFPGSLFDDGQFSLSVVQGARLVLILLLSTVSVRTRLNARVLLFIPAIALAMAPLARFVLNYQPVDDRVFQVCFFVVVYFAAMVPATVHRLHCRLGPAQVSNAVCVVTLLAAAVSLAFRRVDRSPWQVRSGFMLVALALAPFL